MDLALEYLRVILSWPSVTAILGAAILLLFRRELAAHIQRIKTVSFPGGSIDTLQQQRAPIEQSIVASTTTEPPISTSAERSDGSILLSSSDAAKLKGWITSTRTASLIWEFRYLNFFLAPSTQKILEWISTLEGGATSYNGYDAVWVPIISNQQERLAVVTALQAHYLIENRDDTLSITAKGREYLKWSERKVLFRPPLS